MDVICSDNGWEYMSDFLSQDADNVVNLCGIRLTRPGYYTLPQMEELGSLLDENGKCIVENFVVGREGYGNVLWPGLTNVVNANLDAIGESVHGV